MNSPQDFTGQRGEKSRTPDEISAKSVALRSFRFDLGTRTLTDAAGTPVPLRSQSAAVLALLASRLGNAVTRDEIMARVWPDTYVTDDSLVQCIADIRRALGDEGRHMVQTLPKIGYRLSPPASASAPVRRSRVFAATALAALLLLAVAAWSFLQPAPPPDRPRIAVLAFDDFSTGADKGYLSDAIAEGLITELARFDELAVIARSSSFQYRDGAAGIATIRDDLGVHFVLEGSQQKSGDSLKVTAQLIDARSGAHVWSDSWDRDLADLFTVQEEIVRAVAWKVAEVAVRSPLPDADLDRVKAMWYFTENRRNSGTYSRESSDKSLANAEEAIRIDPDSAWGYLALGWAWRDRAVFYTTPEEKPEMLERARAATDRAIALEPNNYIGHYLLARLDVEQGDIAAGLNRYDTAIALNPSATNVLVSSSSPLLYAGRFEEGLARIDAALAIDPRHTDWFHWQRAWALWELDRCDEALDAFQRMAPVPNAAQRMLAATYACLGDDARAHQALRVFLDENPGATLSTEREKLRKVWKNEPSLDRWIEDMRRAGMPEG